MKILFLSRWFPYPANNGSKIRTYNVLRGLGQSHDITLLTFTDRPVEVTDLANVRALCSNVYVIPWREFNPNSFRAKLGFFSLKPRSIIDTFSSEMAAKIEQLLTSQKYDLVIASELWMAAYFSHFKHIPAILEDLELGLALEDLRYTSDWKKRLRRAFTWFKLHMYLGRLLNVFQAVTVVSNQEKKLVSQYFPGVKDIVVIPNCVNMDDYKNVNVKPKSCSLIFTGSFRYYVNYEAMQWFVGQAFPLILEKNPSAELIITGDHVGLSLPSSKNVTLAGYVDDVKTLIASSTVALAPIWSGGGTRLKILEAMAVRTPVIATSKGAEGLGAISGQHLFIADSPKEFAEAVNFLIQDHELHSRISNNAHEFVKKNYDWSRVIHLLLKLVESVSKK